MKTRFNSFLFKHLCKGILVGWGLLLALLVFDLGGLGRLILDSDNAVMAIGLLMAGFAITFGNCAMGIAAVKKLPARQNMETPET